MRHTCGGLAFDWACRACVAGHEVGNARFWVWVNGGWVKLTLRPGQELSTFHGGPADEGWWSERERWEHTGTGVKREWCNQGRDCDGRIEQYWEDFCPLECLADLEIDTPEAEGLRLPEWQDRAGGQYDQYAELAGY